MTCPDDKTLQLFIAGRLAQGQEEQIEKHLDGCEPCSKRLSELETKGKVAFFRDIQAAHAEDSATAMPVEGRAIPPIIPRSIGHYKVIDVLGSGGMGAVYLAENPHLDRKVAVKVVKASRSLHQSSLDRFSREMKAVGKLRHPNIVQALDGGVVDGQPYLVNRAYRNQCLMSWPFVNGGYCKKSIVCISIGCGDTMSCKIGSEKYQEYLKSGPKTLKTWERGSGR